MELSKKKIKESVYLEEIKQIFSDFPKGEVISQESPDFIIKPPSGNIGIEMVEFVRGQNQGGQNLRKIEQDREKILRLAQAKFESRNQVSLYVNTFWTYRHPLSRKEIDFLANSLVEIIEEYMPKEIHGYVNINNDFLYSKPLFNYCDSIYCYRQTGKSYWVYSEVGFVGLSKEDIDNLIEKKAKKLPEYLKDCDKVWLLIVCEGKHISSIVDPTNVITQKFDFPFDKLLLYVRDEKALYDLKSSRE